MIKVLIVDDSAFVRKLLSEELNKQQENKEREIMEV